MIIGYARVSTADQSVSRQVGELKAAGCDKVLSETASGKRGAHRPEWDKAIGMLREGDTLTVTELSRLGRNVTDLGRLREELEALGVSLRILNLGLDTGSVSGKLIFTIIAAVAEMERDLLIERTQSGLAAARARGNIGGRRPTVTKKQVAQIRDLKAKNELTIEQIGRVVGVSRPTVYRYLEDGG